MERDIELRQYQNMWAREKKLKEDTLDELADTQIKLKGVEEDLVIEKDEREKEKQASEQQIMVLNNQVVDLENQKQEDAKNHRCCSGCFTRGTLAYNIQKTGRNKTR